MMAAEENRMTINEGSQDLQEGSSKRPKSAPQATAKTRSRPKTKSLSSRLFTPFRTVGYITNANPFVLQQRGRESYITTCVGRAFQTFDCKTLNIVFVGEDAGGKIGRLTIVKNLVYASVGPEIRAYLRGKHVSSLKVPESLDILQLDSIGQYLLALTSSDSICIWNTESASFVRTLRLDDDSKKNGTSALCMVHPATYLNKVLVARQNGTMQLWNIRTSSLIHSFSPRQMDRHAISCLVQSPVVDIVAVGYDDGTILLFNIRLDIILIKLTQKGKVNAISFRTDGKSLIAVANESGDIVVWDLDEDRLLTTMKGAHEASISSLSWLINTDILMSSGADNAVKEWIFDGQDGMGRLLKCRSGHYEPPNMIRYYGTNGRQIISTSRDRSLRMQSLYRDSQSQEMSQNPVVAFGANTNLTKKSRLLDLRPHDLKLPLVTHKRWLATSTTREKDWSNMITVHEGEGLARLWSTRNKTISRMILKSTRRVKVKGKDMEEMSGLTTCVAMTYCGNYALLGSQEGRVDLYNVQSGQHRRVYDPLKSGKVNSRGLVGVMADSLNRVVVGCSCTGLLTVWSFHDAKLSFTQDFAITVHHVCPIEDTLLLILVLEAGRVVIFDIETRRVVRDFSSRGSEIVDLAVSYDGRWLLTSSSDLVLRTFDIPTGYLIDAFRLPSVATSIAFSPTGDFLATTHADSVGISLWANRSQFTPMPTRNIDEAEIELLELPSMQIADEKGIGPQEEGDPFNDDEPVTDFDRKVEQLGENMLTLSTLPRSKWDTLLNLELIRARNKPIEPPQKPEQAPFFLPAVSTGRRKDTEQVGNKSGAAKINRLENSHDQSSKILMQHDIDLESELWSILAECQENTDFERFFASLRDLSPSALDLEVRSIPLRDDCIVLRDFIQALHHRLTKGLEFEAIQAYTALLFEAHGDLFATNPTLLASMSEFSQTLKVATAKFQRLIQQNLTMINMIRGAPL